MQNSKQYHYIGRLILIAVLVAILTALPGCTTRYVDRPVYVDRAVAVSCVESVPEVPAWETQVLDRSKSLDEVSRAYMIEIAQRRIYESELNAIVKACASVGRPALGAGSAKK